MDLDTYLKQADALSTAELAKRIGVKHVAQVNQWRNPNQGRRPSPENCLAIERETDGQVTRRDLRPDDCERIWPDLAATKRPRRPAKAEA